MFKNKTKFLVCILAGMLAVNGACSEGSSRPAKRSVDKDLFKIGPEDEGRLSQEFVNDMLATVGEEKASRASLDLHYFWLHRKDYPPKEYHRRDDLDIEYRNYLERLYRQACSRMIHKITPEETREFKRREAQWKREGDLRFGEPEPAWISSSPLEQSIRHLRNHIVYLESSAARQAEIDRFNQLSVRYVRGELPIRYNELRRPTPLNVESGTEKKFTEEIATLPPDFCIETAVGGDRYQIGILIPTNDCSSETSTHGIERVIVIWKNGHQFAVHYLPCHSLILKTEVRGCELTVYFKQKSQNGEQHDITKGKTRRFTIDFTYEVYAPVRITNWLNYFMDGLGNIHMPGCCSDRYDNKKF